MLNVIKKIKVVFFILSSISTIFSLWYIVGYLIATTNEIESLKNLGLSLILVLVTSMTTFVFWLWEVYFGPE